jgi:hypothetical protein
VKNNLKSNKHRKKEKSMSKSGENPHPESKNPMWEKVFEQEFRHDKSPVIHQQKLLDIAEGTGKMRSEGIFPNRVVYFLSNRR